MKPKIDDKPNSFLLRKDSPYWEDCEGIEHKIVKSGVCANGVRDLCIYQHGPKIDDVRVGKIAEVPKENILLVPKGDIFWVRFTPPLADGSCAFFMDVASDPSVRELVVEILRRFGGPKGNDYAMYGGDPYLSEG
jgi:hypothetical protein